MSNRSSFSKVAKDKHLMDKHHEEVFRILSAVIQANKTIFSLKKIAKDKKNPTVLKLLPELTVVHERMIRECFAAAATVGYSEAISLGISEPTKLSVCFVFLFFNKNF